MEERGPASPLSLSRPLSLAPARPSPPTHPHAHKKQPLELLDGRLVRPLRRLLEGGLLLDDHPVVRPLVGRRVRLRQLHLGWRLLPALHLPLRRDAVGAQLLPHLPVLGLDGDLHRDVVRQLLLL